MKTEFKARSVYLSREDRIRAHFLICFLSLTLYRLLEKKLGNSYTPRELIHTLQDMNFLQLPIDDYVPAYTRTEITDAIQYNNQKHFIIAAFNQFVKYITFQHDLSNAYFSVPIPILFFNAKYMRLSGIVYS